METREIRLARRPHGEPVDDDFELAARELGEPGRGELLVRNRFMSVDPYMRGRMNDVKSYVPPFELGKALQGGAVGEVVETAPSWRLVHTAAGASTRWCGRQGARRRRSRTASRRARCSAPSGCPA